MFAYTILKLSCYHRHFILYLWISGGKEKREEEKGGAERIQKIMRKEDKKEMGSKGKRNEKGDNNEKKEAITRGQVAYANLNLSSKMSLSKANYSTSNLSS